MPIWQILGIIVLAGALAVPIAALIRAAAGAVISRQREDCPTCGERRLERVNFIKATVLVNGTRTPDCWSYFLCESCRARFKQHLNGAMEAPSDAEWEQYCTTITPTQ